MPYLILQDYYTTIQDTALQQLLASNDSYRLTKQATALTEMISHISQKYDVSDEFRDTVKFSFTGTYKAKQLVYLDATAFSASLTYTLNTLTLYLGNVYYCSTPITVAAPWNVSNWTLLGPQYSFFYIPTPYQEFNYKGSYQPGDFVFWKDKVYKCNEPSAVNTQRSNLQYDTYANVPLINQFPDAAKVTQWSAGVSYVFTGLWPTALPSDFSTWLIGTTYTTGGRVTLDSIIYQAQANSTGVEPGTDITKWLPVSWISGDNRNPQLVELNVFLTIYKLAPRISPKNIPDIWVKNYDDSIAWLKSCAKGFVNLDAPLLQPFQGKRIRWGSEPKRINGY